jgi:hypothetical protein
LSAGLQVQSDAKLGLVVFLGEEGRGRRYEKVGLSRRNPAEVVSGRVMNANPVKITLPAKDGKPEKVFFVLERTTTVTQDVLVRINTNGGYIRNGRGYWDAVSGDPVNLAGGYGAFGDAGRIGNWNDGLVVIHPGDVVRIHPSRSWGQGDSALWLDEFGQLHNASWQDYENLQAVAKTEAVIAEVEAPSQGLSYIFGQMPAFTYAGGGEIRTGLEVSKGVTGPVVSLGEEGRGRKRTEIPLIGEAPKAPCPRRNDYQDWWSKQEPDIRGIKQCHECGLRFEIVRGGARIQLIHPRDKGEVFGVLTETAIVILSEKQEPARFYGDKPTVERIYGLAQSPKTENALLIRVSPTGIGGRVYRRTKQLRGEPTPIAIGVEASGIAGRAGSYDDTLWVMRSGDAVVIESSGENARVIENRGGKLVTTPWKEWEAADGITNPEAYIAKRKAPFGLVPADWVGRIVSIITRNKVETYRGETSVEWVEGDKGELVSLNPLVLNMGWDGRDRKLVAINSGVWVCLHAGLQAKTLDGENAREREQAKVEMTQIQSQAKELRDSSYFSCFEVGLRKRVGQVADGREVSSWSEGSMLDATLATTSDIRRWIESAKVVMTEAGEASPAAKDLDARRKSGEILVGFTTWHRRGGASNLGDGWVIRPDGSVREADHRNVARNGDGDFVWSLVTTEELALSWGKSNSSADHECVVEHAPAVLTPEQLATVRRIEVEIKAPEGAFGLDPEINARNAERFAAIREVASRILQQVPEFGYYQVAGSNGVGLLHANLPAGYDDRTGTLSPVACNAREAWVLYSLPAASGVVEIVKYDKFGTDNYSLRWRPLREDEVIQEPETPVVPGETKPLDGSELGSAIDALRAKFGKK